MAAINILSQSNALIFFFFLNIRFRLKVEVDDGGESGVFVIFDTDCQQLLNRTCKELVSKDKVVAYDFVLCSSIPHLIKPLLNYFRSHFLILWIYFLSLGQVFT